MPEPITFDFKNQEKRIEQLRTNALAERAELDRLASTIELADANLLAAIAAAKQNVAGKVAAFKSGSDVIKASRKESLKIIQALHRTLQDDLRGRSFTVTGQMFARNNPDVPNSAALNLITIEAPGVEARVESIETAAGTSFLGYFANFIHYSRAEHEGYNAGAGSKIDLPESPAHSRLFHNDQGKDSMFEIDPFVIFSMGEEARQAAGIVPLDKNRTDTEPILAHLSKVVLTPLS